MARKPDRKRVAALLDKAREVMNSRGAHWMKGDLTDGQGRYCAIGGLNKAARKPQWYAGEREFSPAEIEARFVLAEAITGERPVSQDEAEQIITDFNDESGVKWGDLSKMFRRAARLALKGAS